MLQNSMAPRTHTIRAGDTLWRLAQQYGTTVEALLAANPGIDPNSLRVGQVISIPTPQPASRRHWPLRSVTPPAYITAGARQTSRMKL